MCLKISFQALFISGIRPKPNHQKSWALDVPRIFIAPKPFIETGMFFVYNDRRAEMKNWKPDIRIIKRFGIKYPVSDFHSQVSVVL